MKSADLPAVMAVQASCYPSALNEPLDVLERRLETCSDTAWVMQESTRDESSVCAYLFAYRSALGKVTPLGGEFESSRRVDSLYLHDLAVSPRMKGQRLAQWLVQHAWASAWAMGLRSSALVAVQGSLPFWARLGYARHQALSPSQAVHLRSYGDGQYMVRHFTG